MSMGDMSTSVSGSGSGHEKYFLADGEEQRLTALLNEYRLLNDAEANTRKQLAIYAAMRHNLNLRLAELWRAFGVPVELIGTAKPEIKAGMLEW